jgi:hypothetical protein
MPRRFWVPLSVLLAAMTTFLVWLLISGVLIAIVPIIGLLYVWVGAVWLLEIQTHVDSLELTRRIRADPLLLAIRNRAQMPNVRRVTLTDIIRTSVEPVARWPGYSIVVVSLRDGPKLALLTRSPQELVAALAPSTTPPDLTS